MVSSPKILSIADFQRSSTYLQVSSFVAIINLSQLPCETHIITLFWMVMDFAFVVVLRPRTTLTALWLIDCPWNQGVVDFRACLWLRLSLEPIWTHHKPTANTTANSGRSTHRVIWTRAEHYGVFGNRSSLPNHNGNGGPTTGAAQNFGSPPPSGSRRWGSLIIKIKIPSRKPITRHKTRRLWRNRSYCQNAIKTDIFMVFKL